MLCNVDHYFVIFFCKLHFLFQRDLVSTINYHHLGIKSQLSADLWPADPQGNMNEALCSLKNLEVLSSRVVYNYLVHLT